MGRITAYDQNGRMVADFDKSDYDFLLRYGRMPEEVLDENAKLRELCKFMLRCMCRYHDCCDCLVNGEHCDITYIESDAQELGVEIGG